MDYEHMWNQGSVIKVVEADRPLFRMYVTNEIENWRYDTFFTKEPETVAWLDSIRNGSIFWDIGANVGIYSLYLNAKKDASQIYIFEPQFTSFNRAIENARLNGWKKWQPTAPCAIGNYNGWARFKTGSNLPGANDGRLESTIKVGDGMDVPVYTVDELAKWLSPCPNHIKIDVDGGEGAIIEGADQTLRNPALQSVLIEVNDDREMIAEAMISRGFTTDNPFNVMTPHSRERRAKEEIACENVIFTRG